jgi:hypothetical protein
MKEDSTTLTIPVKALKSVLHAASKDPVRTVLTGFNINIVHGALLLTCTNGRSLVTVDITQDNDMATVRDALPMNVEPNDTRPDGSPSGWLIDRPAFLPRAGKECPNYRLIIQSKVATLVREDLRGCSVSIPRNTDKAYPLYSSVFKGSIESQRHSAYSIYGLDTLLKAAKAYQPEPTLVFAHLEGKELAFIVGADRWVAMTLNAPLSASESIASLSPLWLNLARNIEETATPTPDAP